MFIIDTILSKEECEKLKNLDFNFRKTRIYNPTTKKLEVNEEIRNLEETSFNLPTWFLVKIKKWLELNGIFVNSTPIVYTLLKYNKGCYFKEHRDLAPHGNSKKIYTLIIELSDCNEYEGGEFVLEGKVINKNIGNVILFDSYKLHELKEITEGQRISFVYWILDTELKTDKSYII